MISDPAPAENRAENRASGRPGACGARGAGRLRRTARHRLPRPRAAAGSIGSRRTGGRFDEPFFASRPAIVPIVHQGAPIRSAAVTARKKTRMKKPSEPARGRDRAAAAIDDILRLGGKALEAQHASEAERLARDALA